MREKNDKGKTIIKGKKSIIGIKGKRTGTADTISVNLECHVPKEPDIPLCATLVSLCRY